MALAVVATARNFTYPKELALLTVNLPHQD